MEQEEDWEFWASHLSMQRLVMENILVESLSKCVQDGEVTSKSWNRFTEGKLGLIKRLERDFGQRPGGTGQGEVASQ